MSRPWKLSKPIFDSEAFTDLRTSPGAQCLVAAVGQRIAARAQELSGRDYVFLPVAGEPWRRAHGIVSPVGAHAMRSSAKHLTLIHAIDAGRG